MNTRTCVRLSCLQPLRLPTRSRSRWLSSASRLLQRQWSTPLAKELAEAITTTGPISLAAYMRQCLTSPTGGYYTTSRTSTSADSSTQAKTDQFGKAGDFVTSPEISQIFGELVGIWFVSEWMSQGQPSSVQLIELGPGRGTLMSDVLRTVANFGPMVEKIESVWLVEASPTLRESQKNRLCGQGTDMKETERGWTSTCSLLPGVAVNWVEDMNFLPKDTAKTPFIVAHEFFDALPIHAFQSIDPPKVVPSALGATSTDSQARSQTTKEAAQKKSWRELVVSPTRPPSLLTTSSITTSVSSSPATSSRPKEQPDFELSVATAATPHSSYLPNLSARYSSILYSSPAGSSIEVSPESLSIVSTLSQLIGGPDSMSPKPSVTQMRRPRIDSSSEPAVLRSKPNPSGAALIIDYGPADTVPVNSLRGIKAHQRVSPFVQPGAVDLSADVDFGALAETAIESSPGVEVHGPIEQSMWLSLLGGQARLEQLLQRTQDEHVKQRLEQGWNRLVDRSPNGMGKVYKVLAIIPYHETLKKQPRRPVGFGGDVV